jgi:uracil-DNA glycosylase
MVALDKLRIQQHNAEIKSCRDCLGLNIPGETESAPPYGDMNSPVVLVGQSLCGPCMKSGIPFTGGSGRLLDRIFELAEVRKSQLFITNVVHCHPPGNRPSKQYEIDNCRRFLIRELSIVRPELVISLGRDASNAVQSIMEDPATGLRFPPRLLTAKHPAFIMRQRQEIRSEYAMHLAQEIRAAFGETGTASVLAKGKDN